jgi:hypothetical protein
MIELGKLIKHQAKMIYPVVDAKKYLVICANVVTNWNCPSMIIMLVYFVFVAFFR